MSEAKPVYEYAKQKTDSTCPRCNSTATLLAPVCPDEMTWRERFHFDLHSAFYICWNCKYIGQVGVGEVKEKITDIPIQ